MKPSKDRILQQRYVAKQDGSPFDLFDLESSSWFRVGGDGSPGTKTFIDDFPVLVRAFGPDRDYLAIESLQHGERCLLRPLMGASKAGNNSVCYEVNRGFPGLAAEARKESESLRGRQRLHASLLLELAAEPFRLLEAGVLQDADVLLWVTDQGCDYFDIAAGCNRKKAWKIRDEFISALTKAAIIKFMEGDSSMLELLRRCGVAVLEADKDGMVDLGSISLPAAVAMGMP